MGRETFTKRQKQLARQSRRMEKAVRLRQRREEKVMGGSSLRTKIPSQGPICFEPTLTSRVKSVA